MFDIALVVCLEGLLELHLLRVPLGVEDLGLETEGLLRDGRGLVGLTGFAFPPNVLLLSRDNKWSGATDALSLVVV